MNSKEKSILTKLNKEKDFSNTIKKLTLNHKLSISESSYILSAALIFSKEYSKDTSQKAFFELAYYIVLKYSLIHGDYRPLYDIALNYGFYPIVKFISDKSMLNSVSVLNSIYEIGISKFSDNGYTETFNQNISRKHILESESDSISYIAPTSFGKSRIIYEHLSLNIKYNKIAIIVPTKSLISQTTKEVRKLNLNKKVLSHDQMYNNDDNFIAILTQERALRLLQKNEIFFDLIYIDEAHNLFEKDYRNVLLQRLIKMNHSRNRFQKLLYLSPLISDSDNLKFIESQTIDEQRIDFNIKEPDVYQLDDEKKVYKYNRFVNEFYKVGVEEDLFSYINSYCGSKNFIYIRSPRKIEDFSKELYDRLPEIEITQEIDELSYVIDKYVHSDFYIKKYLKRGLLYLHGKIPDNIKDYLEHKFKTIHELKFLVANSVILEGVNLPIDTLFILNTYALNEKDLTNLIGRVNRLDVVFHESYGDLNRLIPPIHFIDSKYNSGNIKTINKIRSLRSRYFTDLINNPTLLNFDFDRLKINNKDKDKKKYEFDKIIKNESLIFEENKTPIEVFKAKLIFCGIHNIINLDNNTLKTIKTRLEGSVNNLEFVEANIIEKIYQVFIKDLLENIIDYEFKRLQHEKARNFYKGFIKSRNSPLINRIRLQKLYFQKRIDENDAFYYIGESYGEFSLITANYERPRNMYIDLNSKDDVELINLAIVKIKMEDEFLGFTIRKFIDILFEFNTITEEEYNISIYGTSNKNKINLLKMGFSGTLLSKLEDDNQINNFYLDQYYNLRYNSVFEDYKKTLDDYFVYEIEKITL